MEPTEEHKLPFELIVGDKNGEIQNGDVPVRWCVTPALVKELEDNKILDPHILLVTTTPNGMEMDRKLIPITELMTYARFNKAGEQVMHGFIVNGAHGRKGLHHHFLQKTNGLYDTDLLSDYDGTVFENIDYEYTRTQVNVHIPSGVFGKEPKPWMKWFVNLWHGRNKVTDECHWRQRFILAFTLKWPVVLVYIVAIVIGRVALISFLAAFGYMKDIKYSQILRPFKHPDVSNMLPDIHYVWDDNTLLLRWKKKVNGEIKTIYITSSIVYMPVILIAQALVIYYNAEYFVQTMLMTTGFLLAVTAGIDLTIYLFYAALTSESSGKVAKAVDKGLTSVIVAMVEYFTDGRMRLFAAILFTLAIVAIVSITYLFISFEAILFMLTVMAPLLVVGVIGILLGDKMLNWLENTYTVSPMNNDYTEIRELLCPADAQNLKADIHFIPGKQRTIRLWYLELKNKVCKPMQS